MHTISDRIRNLLPIPYLIPSILRDAADEIAGMAEGVREMSFGHLFAATATIVQNKFQIQVKDNYPESLSLFFLTIAESSERKTSTAKKVIAILNEISNQYNIQNRNKFIEQRSLYDSELKLIAAKKRHLIKFKDNELEDAKKEIALLEVNLIKPESPLVLDIQDVTAPALIQLMESQTANRISIFGAEDRVFEAIINNKQLLDLLNSFYSNESRRVDRLSSGSVLLTSPALSLSIMIHPSLLSEENKRLHTIWKRGFLPRCAVIMPPSILGMETASIVAFEKHEDVESSQSTDGGIERFKKRLQLLFDYPWNKDSLGNITPYNLFFSPEALEEWNSYAKFCKGNNGIEPPELKLQRFQNKEWWGRLPGLAARLAAIFHCLELDDPCSQPISVQSFNYARSFATFFTQSVSQLYKILFPPPIIKSVIKLRQWILSGDRWQPISFRDACRYTGLKIDDLRGVMNYLAQLNIVTFLTIPELNEYGIPKIGRPPSPHFQVIDMDHLYALGRELGI